tara:strand:+ start:184 stop:1323 length:1140 start_codon:yes stop_codon:yes gene_type:complete
MISGNKGEWSELYVLVKLLSDGVLYQADIDLKKDHNNAYEIVKAFKNETDYTLEFQREDFLVVLKNNKIISQITFDELRTITENLYQGILKGKGRSFEISEVKSFIDKALIQKLKANSSQKADIKLRIYDHRLAKETDLGFSIKSLLGGNSTLFNTGKGNNFIFNVENNLDKSLDAFNQYTYSPPDNISKISYRLKELKSLGAEFTFDTIQSSQLWRNLKMIDGDLPEILAWALYYRWIDREPALKNVVEKLEEYDPLNFYDGKYSIQRLYEYKLKRFLTEAAMGMTSETPWLGEYDSFGGVIMAKADGDVLCFHIYDFNIFRDYLLENTMFEQPSTSEDPENPGYINPNSKKNYRYGWLYSEYDQLKFKINLQIRFIR